MSLKVYNTLTRRKEEFVPLHEGRVNMYVCGPTVYDQAHIGHAKSYLTFDIILRYLRYLGYKVRYVQNITDVGHLTDDADEGEDKIALRARQERVEPMELAETYTRSYFEDMDALNIIRPDISPRASGHIPEQIELVKTLLEKGHAYEVNGSVYFSVESFPEYGKLSGRKLEEQQEGVRIDVNPDKRNPLDFALWKRAEPGHIMRWMSPWGEGYPGWHIECSAMSMKYLGETPDIHGGGMENIFPHHECEIAQSEAATGKPFARYWLHNNMVTVEGVKMSKSLGNFVTIKDILGEYGAQVLRFFLLTSHYRTPLDFSEEALRAAQRGLARLEGTVRALSECIHAAESGQLDQGLMERLADFKESFLAAMDDDLNTAGALGALFEMNREVNAALTSNERLSRETLEAIDELYSILGGDILGLTFGGAGPQGRMVRVSIPDTVRVTDDMGAEARELLAKADISSLRRMSPSGAYMSIRLEDFLIEILVSTRHKLRAAKQWELADEIRAQLAELGIVLEDRPEGTVWRYDHS